MKRLLVPAMILTCVSPAWAQNVGGAGVFPPNEVDQVKVDLAIERGVAYLRAHNANHLGDAKNGRNKTSRRELVLLTYAHAGVPETEEDFKSLFDSMMEDKLEATYCVALQAMVLEEVERVKYQKRILQCAQFLVDNQGPKGYWSYGSPSDFVEDVAYDLPRRKDVATAGEARQFDVPQPGVRTKPPVQHRIRVEKRRDGPPGHDNSNTQYAALGLRACHDAGIIIDGRVVDAAMKWLRDCQKKGDGPEEALIEGGVGGPDKGRSQVARKAQPQGWCYGDHAPHEAYGSMTAGAVGSLAIWDYIRDNDEGRRKSWKSDKDIHEGLVWMAKNFSVSFNPGKYEHGRQKDSPAQYYYYLYALERAGMLYGTEIMGSHKWYPEGAKVLIESQEPNGSWSRNPVDTCFAILFLKRATRSLGVATHSAGQMRENRK